MVDTASRPTHEPAHRLRVAVLGLRSEDAGWAAEFAAVRALDVTRVADVEALLAARADLAIVFATAVEADAVTRRVAAQKDAPPVALLIGESGAAHPHAHMLRTLLSAKNDWERTFDAILDPVVVIDARGKVIRANLQLAESLSRDIQSVIGRPYSELFGPAVPGTGDRAGDAEDPIALSLVDRRPRSMEVRFARLPGLTEVTVAPYGEGASVGLVVILKDVSQRKEQQQRLQIAARLADIGQLAAGVAHEINTPLASIALRAESLMKAAEDPRLLAVDSFKNFPRYLKTIDEEIFRCKKIIGALLDFSRARKAEVRAIDVNALAEKAADLVGHQVKLKQVNLALRLLPDLPRVTGDDGQLRQVLIALLMNALDATPPGGHIEVATAIEGPDAIALTVADDGAGIPDQHLDKIFNPFYTTKPLGQGTGLGLSISHGIVASHGGRIRVESEVGKGSRFTLVLPTTRSASAS